MAGRRHMAAALSMALVLVAWTSQARAEWREDFESLKPGPIAGQKGWTADGGEVVGDAAAEGKQSLRLGGAKRITASCPLTLGDGRQVWLDLRVRAAEPGPAVMIEIQRGNAFLCALGLDNAPKGFGQGYGARSSRGGAISWPRYHEQVVDPYTGEDRSVKPGAWVRLTARVDLAAKAADIYRDGRCVFTEMEASDALPDQGPVRMVVTYLPAKAAEAAAFHVDDIRLSAAAPQGVEPARAYPPRPDGLVLRFAVVGDTQMRYPMKHANKYSILGTVVPVLNRLAPDAAFFVGDLIDMRTDPPDKAEEEAKEYYGVWLKQVADLKMPWHPIRGNHDPLPYYANHVKKEIDYVVEAKGVTFICFSSAHPTDGGGWEHMGAVSPEQRKWMEEEMRKAAAKGNRIVTLTHITSMPNQHPLTGWYIREGGEALRKLYEKHGVVAEISGHMHRWLASGEINGVQYIIAPTVRETEGRLAGHGIAVYDVLPDRILQYEKMAHGPYRTEWGKWAKHEIPLPPKRTTP